MTTVYQLALRATRRRQTFAPVRPENQRTEALRLRAEGVSIRDIARTLGVPRSTVGDWARGMTWQADDRRAAERIDLRLAAPAPPDVIEQLAAQTARLRRATDKHDLLVEQALRAGHTEATVAVAAGICRASAHNRKTRANALRSAA